MEMGIGCFVGGILGCVAYWHFIGPLLRAFDSAVARWLNLSYCVNCGHQPLSRGGR